MLTEHQRHWQVDQWAAYLSDIPIPCMPRSASALLFLDPTHDEDLPPALLVEIISSDPFLCLLLLREAEKRRSKKLGHDTTTPFAILMQLGVDRCYRMAMAAPSTDESNTGLAECERRSLYANLLAMRWGSARADLSPAELGMAAILAELGELLLWYVAPEIPQAALDRLASGAVDRSIQAQLEVCGFRFQDLTLKCATRWGLPPLLTQLIRGIDNQRANLARCCIDTARHLAAGGLTNPALPSDIAWAKTMIPAAKMEWLIEQLPGYEPEAGARLYQQIQQLG